MNVENLVRSMESFAESLPIVLRHVSDDEAAWKPPSGNWSLVEIVCHLVDEEIHDFRRRLQMTLEQPGAEWPSWDPETWAVEQKYNLRNLRETIDQFVRERADSVAWLKDLSGVDWETSYLHPKMGPVPAGNLLASWAAHDQLHLRQIAKRKFEMIIRDSLPFDVSYAGTW